MARPLALNYLGELPLVHPPARPTVANLLPASAELLAQKDLASVLAPICSLSRSIAGSTSPLRLSPRPRRLPVALKPLALGQMEQAAPTPGRRERLAQG